MVRHQITWAVPMPPFGRECASLEDSDIAVIVQTCDKYSWFWEDWHFFFSRYAFAAPLVCVVYLPISQVLSPNAELP